MEIHRQTDSHRDSLFINKERERLAVMVCVGMVPENDY